VNGSKRSRKCPLDLGGGGGLGSVALGFFARLLCGRGSVCRGSVWRLGYFGWVQFSGVRVSANWRRAEAV
jgi:hypothetical protein